MKRFTAFILAIALLVTCFGVADDTWTCPKCGREGLTSKFCGKCGTPKPEESVSGAWTCPNCGLEGNIDAFCGDCGTKRPDAEVPEDDSWTCPVCGKTGNTRSFCTKCGTPKEQEEVWVGLVEGTDYEFDEDGCLVFFGTGLDEHAEQYARELTRLIQEFVVEKCVDGKWTELVAEEEATARLSMSSEQTEEIKLTSESSEEEIIAAVEGILSRNIFPVSCKLFEKQQNNITVSVACRVRKGPGTGYALVGELPVGAQVSCVGTANAADGTGVWYEIEYQGKTAYISASVVKESLVVKPAVTPTQKTTYTPKPTTTQTVKPTTTATPVVTATPKATTTAVVTATPTPAHTNTPAPEATEHVHNLKWVNMGDVHRQECTECGYRGELQEHEYTGTWHNSGSIGHYRLCKCFAKLEEPHNYSWGYYGSRCNKYCSLCTAGMLYDHAIVWIMVDNTYCEQICTQCNHEFTITKHDIVDGKCSKCGYEP